MKIDPMRLRRWVVRAWLPVLVLVVLSLYWLFDVVRVPVGMDTMVDSLPPGTVLLLMAHPLRVEPGSVVLLDLPEPIGGTLLTRVEHVADDGSFGIRHDNRQSRFVGLEQRGPYRLADVHGTVFTHFLAAPDLPATGR